MRSQGGQRRNVDWKRLKNEIQTVIGDEDKSLGTLASTHGPGMTHNENLSHKQKSAILSFNTEQRLNTLESKKHSSYANFRQGGLPRDDGLGPHLGSGYGQRSGNIKVSQLLSQRPNTQGFKKRGANARTMQPATSAGNDAQFYSAGGGLAQRGGVDSQRSQRFNSIDGSTRHQQSILNQSSKRLFGKERSNLSQSNARSKYISQKMSETASTGGFFTRYRQGRSELVPGTVAH